MTDARPQPDFRDLEWPIVTERLTLRPAEPRDVDVLWRHRGRQDVGNWLGWHPVDRADWDTTYAEKYLDYLVVEREGETIGDLMLRLGDAVSQREVREHATGVEAELGWAFHPDFGGQGYAIEAVQALMTVCFEGLRLRRIEASAFAANEPSWRLMERVGMRRESHVVQGTLHRDFGWVDGVTYAMLADEWRTAHPGKQ